MEHGCDGGGHDASGVVGLFSSGSRIVSVWLGHGDTYHCSDDAWCSTGPM
jgi:hypothetical protein